MRYFVLHEWYGGFSEGWYNRQFDTFDEMLDAHIKSKPNAPLYNYCSIGNCYYTEVEEVEPTEHKCVYTPQPKEKPSKDPNIEFLEKTMARLMEGFPLPLDPMYGIPLSEYKEHINNETKNNQ